MQRSIAGMTRKLTLSDLVVGSLFFFNNPATTEIYTLSLHDALPISAVHGRTWIAPGGGSGRLPSSLRRRADMRTIDETTAPDRKSTRLNTSHMSISYAVFCLKKKNYYCLFTNSIEVDCCRKMTKFDL